MYEPEDARNASLFALAWEKVTGIDKETTPDSIGRFQNQSAALGWLKSFFILRLTKLWCHK